MPAATSFICLGVQRKGMVINMNVLVVNTAYSGGGAETVARQMINELPNAYGVVNYSKIKTPDNVKVLYNNTMMKVYNRIVTLNHCGRSRHIAHTLNSIKRIVQDKQIDVIHLHNIHGNYFGINDVKELAELRPIVWTLHDMWTMTGNCFFSGDCEGYKSGCRNCKKYEAKKFIRYFAVKEKAFVGHNIVFVTPSEWLKRIAKESWLKQEDIRVINNGVNINNYIAYEKKKLRNQYNLDITKKYIVSVAANVFEVRKGFSILLEALSKIDNLEEFTLLLVGDISQEAEVLLPQNLDVKIMGYIRDPLEMNRMYSLADVFILPSLEDNFPCVTVEALASGTPVIGFRTGGIPEQVDEKTGWIVPEKNADALCCTINEAFADMNKLSEMSKYARCRADKLYSENLMLERYQAIYLEVIEGNEDTH